MSEKPKDRWDKFQIVGGFFGSSAIPIAVLVVGNWVSTVQKNLETDVKFVEIATTVLREAPTDDNHALRKWAINVLVEKSPVKMTPDVIAELERRKVDLVSWIDQDPSKYKPNYNSLNNTKFNDAGTYSFTPECATTDRRGGPGTTKKAGSEGK